jgi:hypothetical protein
MKYYYTFVKNNEIAGNFPYTLNSDFGAKYCADLSKCFNEKFYVFDNYDAAREQMDVIYKNDEVSIIRFFLDENGIWDLLKYANAKSVGCETGPISVYATDIFAQSV